MRKTVIFILCLIAMASCKDFNPMTDSSVRTVRFVVDPCGAFDSILVENGDTVIMVNGPELPAGYCLRTEALCYEKHGSLLRRSICMSDSVAPFDIYLTHIDTTEEYHVVFLTDIVRKIGNGLYEYTWPIAKQEELSTLYAVCVTSFDTELPWLNMLAYCEWEGSVKSIGVNVQLLPATCCSKLRIVNCGHVDKVTVELIQPTSVVFNPLNSKSFGWNLVREILPTSNTYEFPILTPAYDKEIAIEIMTKVVNRIDTVQEEINVTNRPLVLTYDCETQKLEESEL